MGIDFDRGDSTHVSSGKRRLTAGKRSGPLSSTLDEAEQRLNRVESRYLQAVRDYLALSPELRQRLNGPPIR